MALVLGTLRTVAGGSCWLVPGIAGNVFGLGDIADKDDRTAVVARLFGVRDALLGAALLYVPQTEVYTYRLLLQMGLVADVSDVLWCLVALANKRDFTMRGAILTGGGAALFASLGAYALVNFA